MATPNKGQKVRKLTSLVIAISTSNSNVLTADEFAKYGAIMIVGPSTIGTTMTVQVPDADSASPNFATLQSPPATDIGVSASKAIVLTALPFAQVRIHSSADVTAAQTFAVFGVFNTVTTVS